MGVSFFEGTSFFFGGDAKREAKEKLLFFSFFGGVSPCTAFQGSKGLGVESFSILFDHRSSQPVVFTGCLGFQKDSDPWVKKANGRYPDKRPEKELELRRLLSSGGCHTEAHRARGLGPALPYRRPPGGRLRALGDLRSHRGGPVGGGEGGYPWGGQDVS